MKRLGRYKLLETHYLPFPSIVITSDMMYYICDEHQPPAPNLGIDTYGDRFMKKTGKRISGGYDCMYLRFRSYASAVEFKLKWF